MFNYVINRAKEPSTWRGFVLLLTALGISIDPELANGIVAAGLSVAGLIGMVVPDKKKAA